MAKRAAVKAPIKKAAAKPSKNSKAKVAPIAKADDRGAALLADVLANPREDAPRLVYADWLTEQADPRGELIVLQIALARPMMGARAHVYRYGDTERTEQHDVIEERIRRLLKAHQATWLAPFRKVVRTWTWRRGFTDGFEVDAKTFLAGATTLGRHTPIAELQLTAMKPRMVPALCGSAELAPILARLESLDISRQRLGPEDAIALGTAPLGSLEKLELWGNPIGDAGLAAIVASPHLARLRELGAYKCGLTKATLVALATAPCLATLERLDLNGLDGCDAEVATLLARGTRLRELRLGNGVIDDELLQAIAGQSAFARLEVLHLPRCDAPAHTTNGAKALLASPHLSKITRITGVFEYGSKGKLGEQGPLAREFRARFGEDAL